VNLLPLSSFSDSHIIKLRLYASITNWPNCGLLPNFELMSKYVKQLISDDIARRLEGVNDAFVVSFVGMNTNINNQLRTAMAEKQINLMVIKNSWPNGL